MNIYQSKSKNFSQPRPCAMHREATAGKIFFEVCSDANDPHTFLRLINRPMHDNVKRGDSKITTFVPMRKKATNYLQKRIYFNSGLAIR